MGSLKSLAQGFLVATGLIWIFNVMALVRGGDAWLGLTYLLILLIPATSIAILKLTPQSAAIQDSHKWHNLLFAFQGVALAFWSYDLITTFYAINITGLAVELNPLGWPLGILGAFAFYAPTLVFAYVLLYRMKEKMSHYAAVPLTLLTLAMGSMNLLAGAQNFQVFVTTAALASSVRFELLAVIAALDLAIPLTLRHLFVQPKTNFQAKVA
ncbi:MAG: hypothetical protein ACQCN6_04295 [Candidatus Bathyarchaeia archaeon]